jgi:hypothetical protein
MSANTRERTACAHSLEPSLLHTCIGTTIIRHLPMVDMCMGMSLPGRIRQVLIQQAPLRSFPRKKVSAMLIKCSLLRLRHC